MSVDGIALMGSGLTGSGLTHDLHARGADRLAHIQNGILIVARTA